MQNSKRFEELRLQLPVLFGLDMFDVQPNFITGGMAPRLDAFIMGPFLKFLGMVEIFFRLRAGFDVFFVRHPGVVAIVQLERRVARACILGVVIRKLSHR